MPFIVTPGFNPMYRTYPTSGLVLTDDILDSNQCIEVNPSVDVIHQWTYPFYNDT